MSNKLYRVLSYNDYVLKVLVFSYNNEKCFLLYEQEIEKINLLEVKSDIQKDQLALKISTSLEECEKNITHNDNNKQIYIVFDSELYYFDSKTFHFEFPEDHVVNKTDITKVFDHVTHSEKAESGFTPVFFNLKKLKVEDKKEIKSPIGSKIENLSVYGESVFVDSNTYYSLISIVESYGYKIRSLIEGNYLLKENVELENNEIIMEIGTEKINFIHQSHDGVKHFSLPVGFRKVWEQLYEEFLKTYDEETSEKLVRFLMEKFMLNTYDYEYEIFPNIMLNDIINTFREVLRDYYKYIFAGLKEKEMNINVVNILLHQYISEEFIELLNEVMPQIEFKKLKIEEFNGQSTENLKACMSINMFNEIEKALE